MEKTRKNILVFICIAAAFLMAAAAMPAGKKIRQFKLMGEIKGFEKLAGYCCDIYYEPESAEHAKTVLRIVENSYSGLKADFGLYEDIRPQIVVYKDEQSLYRSIGKDYGDNPPMGVYYAGIINILSPENWTAEENARLTDQFMEYGPVIHELSHLFLDAKTGGNYELWFSEGVALYTEFKYTGTAWQSLGVYPAELKLSDMPVFFSSANETLAYKAAFDKVCSLVQTYGETALEEIYESLQTGEQFGDIILKYGD